MLYALVDGVRTEARPRNTAACPTCGATLVPKCGEIKAWHWAHRADMDCDPWAEGETAWHLDWKRQFPVECCEVRAGPHRADVAGNGYVLEIQHSPLTPDAIRARERFYGAGLVWLWDARAWHLDLRPQEGYVTFRWRWPHLSLRAARRPVYLDVGDRLLKLGRVHWDLPVGGWGQDILPPDFVAQARRAMTPLPFERAVSLDVTP